MNTIKVLPIDRRSFTSYPLPENGAGVIEISENDYAALLRGEAQFGEDLKSVMPCEPSAPKGARGALLIDSTPAASAANNPPAAMPGENIYENT